MSKNPGEVFFDRERAETLIAQLAKRLPPSLGKMLPTLLQDSPDPDSSLVFLDRLVSAYPAEMIREFERTPALFHYAALIFGHSHYLSETLIQSPDLLLWLQRRTSLNRNYSPEEIHQNFARFSARSDADLSLTLARFKRREYIRIMLRDVLRIAPLSETAAEISLLSDVLIEIALHEAHRRVNQRFGIVHLPEPRSFAVLALGKLGGNELNYSSDVDLFYIYGEPCPAAQPFGQEYFIRFAQELTSILSQLTPEGPVFRIDLRLRPQGNEGELAISIEQALRYYAEAAADWERQALTKARFAAGDAAIAKEFIRGIQPHVYTAQLNYAAIETALQSRRKMHQRRRAAPQSRVDVKLNEGGIRDIEFLVQCLQRVYGGAEPWLRSASTMSCLQKLCDKRHISDPEFGELSSAYELLRHVEHRLQLRFGRQTHQLPDSEHEMRILSRAMTAYVVPGEKTDLPALLLRRMSQISEICTRVLVRQQSPGPLDSGFELSSPIPRARDSSELEILRRLSQDAPALYAVINQVDLTANARKRLFLFLSAANSSSSRYGTLLREASAIPKLLQIFEMSGYLTDALTRHPEQIATIAALEGGSQAPVSSYLFQNLSLLVASPADPVFDYLASAALPYGEKLAMLRRHYWHRCLVSGARDVLESRRIYESLAETSSAAEEAIRTAFAMVGAPRELAVLALGRIGSGEFDLLSDADLIFISEDAADRAQLEKVAQQIVHVLAAYTREGSVFPVDTRLRPRGNQGDLVVSTAQLAEYFRSEAQPWEALVYTKLRFVAGARPLADRALCEVQSLFARFQDDSDFRISVLDMRRKLEASDPEGFKTGPGGIYDIDFLASFLLIAHGIPQKNGTLRDRLWRLAGADALEGKTAAELDHAAEFLRTVEHAIRLVTGRAQKTLPGSEHALQSVEKLTARHLERSFPEGLVAECDRCSTMVREIYERELNRR